MKRLLLAALCVIPVLCQEEPGVRLRSSVSPEGGVLVGQPVRLTVDVLVTTWLTGAPEFPDLGLPGAVVLLPDERPLNLSEEFEGQRWFGLSRSYLIYPQEPREYVTPPEEVILKYGGGSQSPARLAIPEQPFSARVPTEAAGLGYFIPTTRFRIEQKIEPVSSDLKAGDSIRRTVTMTADGSFAMFIPPVPFDSAQGLAVYPDPPTVENLGGDRTGFQGGRRIDSASYLIQQDGEYTLPAINISWWDLGAGRLRNASAPAVTFSAAPNPDYRPEIAIPFEQAEVEEAAPPSSAWREFVDRWSLPLVVALAAGAVLLLAMSRFVPFLRRRLEEHRRHHEASEAAAFDRLARACRSGDARATGRLLYTWLDRIHTSPGAATFHDVAVHYGSEQLSRQGDLALTSDPGWDGKTFLNGLSEARTQLLHLEVRRKISTALPPLNPKAPQSSLTNAK